MIAPHGGNIRSLAAAAGIPQELLLDFSANLNPLGPPEWLRSLISSQVEQLIHYPDPDCTALIAAFAERFHVPPFEVLMGNGETELLHLLPRVLGKARALIPSPAYGDYRLASVLAGMAVETLPLEEGKGFVPDLERVASALKGDEILFIGQPNNPTGCLAEPGALREMSRRHPGTYVVVDEAFLDFTATESLLDAERPPNLLILRSMTKFYAIPGLRLGACVAETTLADRIRSLMPPWSVNTLAQAVGVAALKDTAYGETTRRFVAARRQELLSSLQRLPGLTVYPGTANFLLVRSERGDLNAPAIAEKLLAQGIAIRLCGNFTGLDDRFFRIAVRTERENGRLLDSLRRILGVAEKRPRPPRHTPCLMIQGTGSNAGKSVIVAALCRILLQEGLRVAPFKAQNMSLNSYVTREGREMGRAQVVQAQACRLDPDVRMNPVLLKPHGDRASQVIVMGKPIGNMDFGAYTREKGPPLAAAREAFDSLAQEYDAIVLEGAGSPGEVNLKTHDIVNMSMARYARAPVLICGDIDRGGLYASFIGHMEVLTEEERALVKGFLVNRFRGEAAFLAEAHAYVLKHTGRPVLGVIPFLRDWGLPEEDSVSFKNGLIEDRIPSGDHVEVAVIDLPHISNFTDLDPLRIEPDVRLRIVRVGAELGNPDALILPGSKNVIADLADLVDRGMSRQILALASAGRTEIVGICGGLQLLGTEIADPLGIEGAAGRQMPGMGLLPVRTELAREKTLTRTEGRHLASGLTVWGYEIHHGLTEGNGTPTILRQPGGRAIGMGTPEGRIWGTYLHGIFDADPFRRWWINGLRRRKGIVPLEQVAAVYTLEPAFERLAAAVRKGLQMDAIYQMMGL